MGAGANPTFNFTVKLTDQVSTANRAIQNGIQTTAVMMRKLEIQVQTTFQGIHSHGNKAASAFDTLIPKAQTLLGVLAAIGTAAAFAFSKLNDFSNESLKAFGSREAQIKSYEQLFKSRDEARFEYGRALNIAQATPTTAEDVLKTQRQLAVAGLRGEHAHELLSGILDMGTAAPDEERSQVLKRAAYAIKEIQTMGKLRSRQLNMQLGTAGLNVGLVHEAIAEGRGFKADPNSKLSVHDQQADFVENLLRKGKVRSDEGLAAIKIALSRQFNDGGKLGSFAKNQAGTIATLQSNRDEALENLKKSFDADLLPAVRRYKAALKESAEAMNTNTESGRNLRTVLADIGNTGIGLKATFEAFTTAFVEEFGRSYVTQLKEMGVTSIGLENKMNDLAVVAKDLGRAIGGIGSAVAWVIHQFDKLSKVGEAARHTLAADKLLLSGDVKGYAREAQAALLALKKPDATNIETAAQAAARTQKEIEEFSYVQAGSKGGGVMKGGGLPLDARGRPIRGLQAKPTVVAGEEGAGGHGGAGGGSGGGAGGGGGYSSHTGLRVNTLHVELHVGGHWDEHAKAAIRDEAPGILKEMLEKTAMEMGIG